MHLLLDALALAEPGGFIRTLCRRRSPDGAPLVRSGGSWEDAGLYRDSCWLHCEAEEQKSEGTQTSLPHLPSP